MPEREHYLTVKAAAEYLGVCPNTLRNWDRDGKIAVYRHPANGYHLLRTSGLEETPQLTE